MSTDEIFKIKGEWHYVIPNMYPDGNSCRCDRCRYFAEDPKNKKYNPFSYWGECRSKAHQTEKSGIHRKNGWDKTISNCGCHWWFPIEPQPGENATIFIQEEK